MKKLSSIKRYPTNLVLFAEDGTSYTIDFDGLAGEFSREEWLDDPDIAQFDEDGREQILSSLSASAVIKDEPSYIDLLSTLDDIFADYGGNEIEIPDGINDPGGEWSSLTEAEARVVFEHNGGNVDACVEYGE